MIKCADGLGLRCIANQPDRLAWNAQADGDFRADRDKLEIFRERAAAQPRLLVPAVVAHVETHQAGADGDFRFGGSGQHRSTSNLNLYKHSGLYNIPSS
ncbi:hypothetical protein D3C81_1928780 [compost metagenome]